MLLSYAGRSQLFFADRSDAAMVTLSVCNAAGSNEPVQRRPLPLFRAGLLAGIFGWLLRHPVFIPFEVDAELLQNPLHIQRDQHSRFLQSA